MALLLGGVVVGIRTDSCRIALRAPTPFEPRFKLGQPLLIGSLGVAGWPNAQVTYWKLIESPSVKFEVDPSLNQAWKFQVSPARAA